MNGAITEPCVNTIRVPNKTMVIISGANQYFFWTLLNSLDLIKILKYLIKIYAKCKYFYSRPKVKNKVLN